MFIQTEDTPNPATMKFLPGQALMTEGTRDYTAPEQAETSPLARSLFRINGVTGVFLARDFLTVTKDAESDWRTLRAKVLAAIMDHMTSGLPATDDQASTVVASSGDPTIDKIRELLDTRIRPAVAQDGGDIVFDRFEDGVVYLHMQGSCSGCPSSTMTLKAGVENMLKHYVPEVKEVRASAR